MSRPEGGSSGISHADTPSGSEVACDCTPYQERNDKSVIMRFLPNTCPACKESVPRAAATRCPSCHHPLRVPSTRTGHLCVRCGETTVQPTTSAVCLSCRKQRPSRLAKELVQ